MFAKSRNRPPGPFPPPPPSSPPQLFLRPSLHPLLWVSSCKTYNSFFTSNIQKKIQKKKKNGVIRRLRDRKTGVCNFYCCETISWFLPWKNKFCDLRSIYGSIRKIHFVGEGRSWSQGSEGVKSVLHIFHC